jgi:hypothetical protein
MKRNPMKLEKKPSEPKRPLSAQGA